MFDLIKKTFCAHHGRCRKAPLLARDETANNEAKTALLNISRRPKSSQKFQLPPIPSLKPLTLSDLAAELNDTLWIEKNTKSDAQRPIRRKPLPFQEFGSSSLNLNEPVKFDPNTPLTNKSIHAWARKILKERYQSKYVFDSDPAKDLALRAHDFIWVDEEELERKVLDDIIWVRQRYAQARRKEPNDQDIIWWYDAEDFANGILNDKG